MAEIPEITVHGRFQPPLHVNHWEFIHQGFDRADHVTLLITNPFNDESFEASASWRSDPTNNPFTYDERVEMFTKFFGAMSIDSDRFDFKPFNIKDPASFADLDPKVPNLVNVYSEWSEKKLESFREHGLPVIELRQPKSRQVSGTLIREIIKQHQDDADLLETKLVAAGFMPEAVPGLLAVLKRKHKG